MLPLQKGGKNYSAISEGMVYRVPKYALPFAESFCVFTSQYVEHGIADTLPLFSFQNLLQLAVKDDQSSGHERAQQSTLP